jgi:glycosyltransferase involved in cell wall biosynthesis
MANPDLTIGFPVYNGAALLSRALASLLAQTHRDFILHISDNASNDGTAELCRQFAAQDERIIYVRQPHNIGPVKNFRFLLQQAKTPFFMWAAHDDLWDPQFVEENISAVKKDPFAIACISRIGNCLQGRQVSISLGTCPLRGSVKENMRTFWSNPQDAARLYAVYRTEVIRASFPDIPWIHAFDYLIVALTLQFGAYLEVPEVLMWRELPDGDRYLRIVDGQPLWFRLFPGVPLTYYMVRYCNPRYYATFARSLLSMNVTAHRWYVSNRFPSSVIALNKIIPRVYSKGWVQDTARERLIRRSAEKKDSQVNQP